MNPISAAKPRGGNGMDGGDVMMNADEPGAVDNRLSITPADFSVIAGWKDGNLYSISELGDGVMLRQISPGEFEVIPGTATAAEPEAEIDEEANPAMDAMMNKYRA